MKTQQLLIAVALLNSQANCLPQVFVNPGRTTVGSLTTLRETTGQLGNPFTLPPGVTLPSGFTLPPGFTIGTEITRSGTLPGVTIGDPTTTVKAPSSTKKASSSSVKTTSSSSTSKLTSKSTTSYSPPAPTTTPSTSKSSTPPSTSSSSSKPPPPPTTKSSSVLSTTSTTSTTSYLPPPTTSSTSQPPPPTSKSTSTSSSLPVITPPPSTKTTSSSTKTTAPPVTTSKADPSTNPYASDCPIPGNYTVNNFISYSGSDGAVSLTITYGDVVFTCPNSDAHTSQTKGVFTLQCDDDGLVTVVTDGEHYIQVQERFYCDDVQQPSGSSATLQSSGTLTLPADTLYCDTDDIGVRTCLQLDPDIVIPVQTYTTGGPIGFTPIDTDGNSLQGCSTVYNAQPIVYDTATCTEDIATSSKISTTVRFTQTNTITIGV